MRDQNITNSLIMNIVKNIGLCDKRRGKQKILKY